MNDKVEMKDNTFVWHAYKFDKTYYIEVATKYTKTLIPYEFIKEIYDSMEDEMERYDGNIPTNKDIAEKLSSDETL